MNDPYHSKERLSSAALALVAGLVLAFAGSPAMAIETDPIPGVDVKLGKNPGGIIITAPTDKNGSFRFTDLEPGTYDISIHGQPPQSLIVGPKGEARGKVMRGPDGALTIFDRWGNRFTAPPDTGDKVSAKTDWVVTQPTKGRLKPDGGDEKSGLADHGTRRGSRELELEAGVPLTAEFEAAARNTLKELAEAYSGKSRSAFMRLVSEDFAGDPSLLEDALVRDFRNYRSINLDLIPNRVEIEGPSASVEFFYNLTIISDLGANTKFSGRSNYIFRQEDGKVRLYKMEKPILFGNSLSPSENPMAASQNSLTERESSAPGAQSAIRGSSVILDPEPGIPNNAFKFDSQSNVPKSSADIFKSGGDISAKPGIRIVSIGACNLDSITSVPASITGSSAVATVGECYAVRTAANTYSALRVTAIAGALGPTTINFDYKFQPSGSNSF